MIEPQNNPISNQAFVADGEFSDVQVTFADDYFNVVGSACDSSGNPSTLTYRVYALAEDGSSASRGYATFVGGSIADAKSISVRIEPQSASEASTAYAVYV